MRCGFMWFRTLVGTKTHETSQLQTHSAVLPDSEMCTNHHETSLTSPNFHPQNLLEWNQNMNFMNSCCCSMFLWAVLAIAYGCFPRDFSKTLVLGNSLSFLVVTAKPLQGRCQITCATSVSGDGNEVHLGQDWKSPRDEDMYNIWTYSITY